MAVFTYGRLFGKSKSSKLPAPVNSLVTWLDEVN
jgi:hypothetical protein